MSSYDEAQARAHALALAVDWTRKFVAPSENFPTSKVVDIAAEFLVFLSGSQNAPQAEVVPNRDVNRNPNSKRDNRLGKP